MCKIMHLLVSIFFDLLFKSSHIPPCKFIILMTDKYYLLFKRINKSFAMPRKSVGIEFWLQYVCRWPKMWHFVRPGG